MNVFREKLGNTIIAVLVLANSLVLIGIMEFYKNHEERTILQQNQLAKQEQMENVIHLLKAVMVTGSAEIAQTFADQLKAAPGIIDFRIMRPNGEETFRDNQMIREVNNRREGAKFTEREDETQVQILAANHPSLVETLGNLRISTYQEASEEGLPQLTLLAPITTNQQCQRCHGGAREVMGVLKLTTSMTKMYEAIADARLRAIKIILISLIIMFILVRLLIHRTLVIPITQTSQAMIRIMEGDFSQTVPMNGHNELSHMAASFNEMSSRLLATYTGLEQEQNKLSTIILSAREGIIVTDQEDHVVLVNPAAERLLGKTQEQIQKEGFLNFFDDPHYVRNYIETGGLGMPEVVVYNQKMLSIYANTIHNRDQVKIGSAALFRDITEEKRLESKLRDLSYTDELTGLFNRRRLEELLKQEYDRARRYHQSLTVMMFDVDHFKRFNDDHGHDQGDRVLQALGHLMKAHFRATDSPCRYGGEEFMVIMPCTPIYANDLSHSGGVIVAERFRAKVAAMAVDGLQVTISIGLAVFQDDHSITSDELLKMADDALYLAKRSGRNQTKVFGKTTTPS